MKTIRVSEATNTQLDWLVAKCEGHRVGIFNTGEVYLVDTPWANKSTIKWIAAFKPSVAWSQMGPIIERERINIDGRVGWAPGSDSFGPYFRAWQGAHSDDPDGSEYGPTPLIAAARCYVVSKMGETVEIPEELT